MNPATPPDWNLRYSQEFHEQLDSRRYRRDRDTFRRRVAEMMKDPYQAARSERLRHQFRGLRSARVTGSTRLIYRICEECRRLEDQSRRPLDCCIDGRTPDRTVNILCLSEHYEAMPEHFDFEG